MGFDAVAQKLAEFDAQNIDWVVSYVYATHRIGSTEAARKILLNAQPRFPKEGTPITKSEKRIEMKKPKILRRQTLTADVI